MLLPCWGQRNSVPYAVAGGVPSAARTHAVPQHRGSERNAALDFPAPDQSQAPAAIHRNHCHGGRDDPANAVRYPAHPYFVGSTRNVGIGRTKFETPEPEASLGLAATRLLSAGGKQGCLGATCARVFAMMAVVQFPAELYGAIEHRLPSSNCWVSNRELTSRLTRQAAANPLDARVARAVASPLLRYPHC
jgi:hypothetical protein